MLSIESLLNIVSELNNDIETGIENLCEVEKVSIETDGKEIHINFSRNIIWNSVEGEEIKSKRDLELILYEELRNHKTQVDGMLGMWKPKEDSFDEEYPKCLICTDVIEDGKDSSYCPKCREE